MSYLSSLHNDHIARQYRINARAVPDDGIDLRRRKRQRPVPPASPAEPVMEIAAEPPPVVAAPIVEEPPAERQSVLIPAVAEIIPPVAPPTPPKPTLRAIQAMTVAEVGGGLSLDMLLGRSRSNAVVPPRQIAMFLCYALRGDSFPSLGRRFGGRDHTTVLYGCHKTARLIREGHESVAAADRILARLRATWAIDDDAAALARRFFLSRKVFKPAAGETGA